MVFQPVLVELNELLQYISPWLVHFQERLKATCSYYGQIALSNKGVSLPRRRS